MYENTKDPEYPSNLEKEEHSWGNHNLIETIQQHYRNSNFIVIVI